MIEIVERYSKNIINLIGSIIITDKKKNRLDTYKGVEMVCKVVKNNAGSGKKILFIGNGGSAAIASHMAIDFWKNGKMTAMAFNDGSLLTCISNDFGYNHVFEKPLEVFANKGDVLFAISSSGSSENILRGVYAASAKRCAIITLSGFKEDNPLRVIGDFNFYVPSLEYGPVEVIHQYICHWVLDIIMTSKSA